MESTSRLHSLTSSAILKDGNYDTVDLQKLYESVLKLVILEYYNEVRFRTPIIPLPLELKPQVSSSTSSTNLSRYYRSSKNFDNDPKLPPYLVSSLEKRLNLIAMKKDGKHYDEMTRRSILRLYSEFLDPEFKRDVIKNNTPEYLVMKFVSCANKELVKVGTIPAAEISEQVFVQAGNFVSILIELIKKDKESDAIIAKLQENKESLKPRGKLKSAAPAHESNLTYPKPSFKITDFDQSHINLIIAIFSIDKVKLQQDIIKFKDISQPKCLHQDVKQILFYLGKDLGQSTPKEFKSAQAYQDWKAREEIICNQLNDKYKVLPTMKLIAIPSLPTGSEYYILPTRNTVVPFLVTLTKLCLDYDNQNEAVSADPDGPLLSKTCNALLNIVTKVWRVDPSTKCTAIYTAGHLMDLLKEKQSDSSEATNINLENSAKILQLCKKIIEDNNMDWEAKDLWSIKDQDAWVKDLLCTYNDIMFAIKDNLAMILNKTTKPSFAPYLMFLGDYIESDSLFHGIEESGVVKKWERKLSKSLLKVAEIRYSKLLANLPRDDTLDISHVLEISNDLVSDIRFLQKRYKNPLLGFLPIAKNFGSVVSSMFAVDAKNILKHIEAYAESRDEFISYVDAIEAYRSLSEIRYIHNQVVTPPVPFEFKLENFFYKYLEAWLEESGDKISAIVQTALESDNYQPIDTSNESRKFSNSILDIFSLIKEFFNILKGLGWQNEFQIAQAYTVLLKSISDGSMHYANTITRKIMMDLDVEEQKKTASNDEKLERRKSGGWFDGVKNAVSNINTDPKLEIQEPYQFMPETCVALNNLAALKEQLVKLEDIFDPEQISQAVNSKDPNSANLYTSHVFSIRLVRAENLRSSNSTGTNLNPYVTLIDTKMRKTFAKTRALNSTCNPEWDEEFEVTLPANSNLTISATVWDRRLGTHSICGRALIQLDPKRFKHDGIPEEIYLDLDSLGRILIEVAVERERLDAIFVMGRAHRAIKRYRERCIKLMVEKFSKFIHYCFSRSNLKTICGSNGNIKPTQEQMDLAMAPLYEYLNLGLLVLAEYLTNTLLLEVMLASWNVVLASADDLLLPNLASAKSIIPHNAQTNGSIGWQSAVTSAVANVTNSFMGGKPLTHIELETVFSWLNYLCLDFFHNGGAGPAVEDLKNEYYQGLLLIPIYYDSEVDYLLEEVERLSPAYLRTLRDRNNFDHEVTASPKLSRKKPGAGTMSRATSIMRTKTINANATAKARELADKQAKEARSDPTAAQAQTEDFILRILIIRDEKSYVARRLEQRERLARSLATERLARAAAEGRFQ